MMKGKMCGGHWVAYALVVIGALNWGLVGAFNFNLVNKILGPWSTVEKIVYILVGVAGIMMLFCGKCKACKMDGKMEEKKM